MDTELRKFKNELNIVENTPGDSESKSSSVAIGFKSKDKVGLRAGIGQGIRGPASKVSLPLPIGDSSTSQSLPLHLMQKPPVPPPILSDEEDDYSNDFEKDSPQKKTPLSKKKPTIVKFEPAS
jgi:hypothetical protein